jgi:hypothetical protein
MSSGCEIVRYRANMETVFSVTYYENVLELKNDSNGVKKKLTLNSLLRYSKFDP